MSELPGVCWPSDVCWRVSGLQEDVGRLNAEIERLWSQLDAIKRHWQFGVQEMDSPWRRKMAELVGDTEDGGGDQ